MLVASEYPEGAGFGWGLLRLNHEKRKSVAINRNSGWCLAAFFLICLLLPLSARAGHLFTQASANTPINLTAGQGIQITQLTYEGVGTAGNVSINFSGGTANTAWSAGDAIKLTIGSWTATYAYDTLTTAYPGAVQTGSALVLQDPTLAATNIDPNGQQTQWIVIASAGDFTFEGYRIYTNAVTFNGTGAAPINQAQVVNASQLGGTFVPVAGPGEVNIAGVLDGLVGNATGQMGNVLTLMSAMTPESKQLAMKLISPERSQVLGQSAMGTVTSALDTVQVRLDSLRTGVGVESGFRTSFNGYDAGHASATGSSAGDETLDRNFWIKAFGGRADQDAKDGFAGSSSDIAGLMAGVDTNIEGGWLVGASLAYAKSNVNMTDFRNGDGADIDTYQLTGYFGRTLDRWYLEGMATYAYQNYLTTRNTHLTGVAEGDFNGYLYGMRLLAGMPIAVREGVTLTPYAGIEAHHIKQFSYAETGAGVLSLNVSSNNADRLRSLIGAELGTLRKLNDGSVLRPALKFNWRHEFLADGVNTTASLLGGGGQFESTGQAVNRNIYGLTGRLNWEKTERLDLAIELGVEAGQGYRSLNGQIFGSWRF